jgi:hypothetical protein
MGTAPLNQKWKLHFHVPAFPVPTVPVRHCVSFGAFGRQRSAKHANIYKTLG